MASSSTSDATTPSTLLTTLTTTLITTMTTTATTRIPKTTPTTVTPGTGEPDPTITFAALATSSTSLLACLLVLLVYLIHIQRPNTVLKNSLNYLWAFVVFVGILGALKTVVGRAMWYSEGSNYAGDKDFCTFGAAADAGERVLMALSLLAFYVNMYVVRKYDEPYAMRCVKWYALFISIFTGGVMIFSALTAPSSYERHGQRCVVIIDSIHGNVPLILPLVIELTIVVVGLVSAFGLLCSHSKINNSSSRRRVWLHVFFMTFLFASRLAMTVATIVYGMDENNNESKNSGGGDDGGDLLLHSLDLSSSSSLSAWDDIVAHSGDFYGQAFFGGGKGKSKKGLTVNDAPTAIRAMILVNIVFTWALGLIVSAIFFYAECLYLVVRVWCVLGCGSEYDDEDVFEPFLRSNASFLSERQSSANPSGRGVGLGTDNGLDDSTSQVSSRYGEESRAGSSVPTGGLGGAGHVGHHIAHNGRAGSHLSATYRGGGRGGAALEENLQGYTLSYTIRSSSNFADGEIPAV